MLQMEEQSDTCSILFDEAAYISNGRRPADNRTPPERSAVTLSVVRAIWLPIPMGSSILFSSLA